MAGRPIDPDPSSITPHTARALSFLRSLPRAARIDLLVRSGGMTGEQGERAKGRVAEQEKEIDHDR